MIGGVMEAEVVFGPTVEDFIALKSKATQAEDVRQASERKVEEMRAVIEARECEIAKLKEELNQSRNECGLRLKKSEVENLIEQKHRDLVSANSSLKSEAAALRVKLKDAEARIQELVCKVATASQYGGKDVAKERAITSTFAILEKNARDAAHAKAEAEARSVELNLQVLQLERKVTGLESALKKASDSRKAVEAEKENS